MNYAFYLYVPSDRVNDALAAVAQMADDDSRQALLAALPYQPRGIFVVPSKFTGKPMEVRVGVFGLEGLGDAISLRFPVDDAISEYAAERGGFPSPREREGIIGAIGLDLTAGSRYTELVFRAYTGDMSLLFSRSSSIHASFTQLLEVSQGVIGAFNDENFEYYLLPDLTQTVTIENEPFMCQGLLWVDDVDAKVDEMLWQRSGGHNRSPTPTVECEVPVITHHSHYTLYFPAARIDDALTGVAEICDESSKNALLAALPYRPRGRWRFVSPANGACAEQLLQVSGLEAIEDSLMLRLRADAAAREIVQAPARPEGVETETKVSARLEVTVGVHYACVELTIDDGSRSTAIQRCLSEVLHGAGGSIGLLRMPSHGHDFGKFEYRSITDAGKSLVLDKRKFCIPQALVGGEYDVDALVPELTSRLGRLRLRW